MRALQLPAVVFMLICVFSSCSDNGDSHTLVVINASRLNVLNVEAKMAETIMEIDELVPGGKARTKYAPAVEGGLSVSWSDADGKGYSEEFAYVSPGIPTVEVFVIGCDKLRTSETVVIDK